MVNNRTVSAPYSCMSACGSTVLPFDFDILAPFFSTIPWVSRRVKGSACCAIPASRMSLWKNRA